MKFDLREVESYYIEKLREFGGNAKGMDWKNEDTQYLRFEMISRYINFSRIPSILDVGCGNSEYLNFCNKKSLSCKYNGLDIIPEMVKLSNERYDKIVAKQGDLESIQGTEKYDYVIASGTFNAKLNATEGEWREYFFRNLKIMFDLSETGMVFNCMSHHVDYRYDRLFYLSDAEISNFIVSRLSKKYIIDHSYPLFEMTIAVFK